MQLGTQITLNLGLLPSPNSHILCVQFSLNIKSALISKKDMFKQSFIFKPRPHVLTECPTSDLVISHNVLTHLQFVRLYMQPLMQHSSYCFLWYTNFLTGTICHIPWATDRAHFHHFLWLVCHFSYHVSQKTQEHPVSSELLCCLYTECPLGGFLPKLV
jgi:hypothetical protein